MSGFFPSSMFFRNRGYISSPFGKVFNPRTKKKRSRQFQRCWNSRKSGFFHKGNGKEKNQPLSTQICGGRLRNHDLSLRDVKLFFSLLIWRIFYHLSNECKWALWWKPGLASRNLHLCVYFFKPSSIGIWSRGVSLSAYFGRLNFHESTRNDFVRFFRELGKL